MAAILSRERWVNWLVHKKALDWKGLQGEYCIITGGVVGLLALIIYVCGSHIMVADVVIVM